MMATGTKKRNRKTMKLKTYTNAPTSKNMMTTETKKRHRKTVKLKTYTGAAASTKRPKTGPSNPAVNKNRRSSSRAATTVAKGPTDKKTMKQALAYVGPGSDPGGIITKKDNKPVSPETTPAERSRNFADIAKSMRPDVALIKDELPNGLLLMSSVSIILLFVSLFVWTAYSQLDSAVAVRGKIISSNSNIVLQPLNGGIVREMGIRIGDVVRKGDVLITLDNTNVDADLKTAKLTLETSRARQQRVQAQLEGRTALDVISLDSEIDALEQQLFKTEQAQHVTIMNRFDQELSQLEATALRLESIQQQLQAEEKVAEELFLVHKDLYEKEQDAYKRDGPWRIQHLSTKQKWLASQRALTETTNQIESTKLAKQLKETEKRQFIVDRELSLSMQLQEASLKHSEASTIIKKYQQAHKVVEIVAPEDGIVLALSVKGPGSVVQAAETLVELVPVDAHLEAEIFIAPHDIACVGKDAEVAIKLDALPFTRYGEIKGRLRLISEDTVKESLSGQGLLSYRGRVSLDQFGLRNLPNNFRLMPGMQLEANINTGYQTILSYLFFPITRALQESFKEQ